MSERDELLHNAVLFLLDPKVKDSSLTSRITFLEGKGLTESEIQEALRRASSGTGAAAASGQAGTGRRDGGWDAPARAYSGSSGAGYGYSTTMEQVPAPAFPRRDWRDVFIMAVISGGVVYGLTALARKYLVPHLQPPTATAFQQTSQSLEESYDQAQSLLTSLTESTQTLQTSLEADRERVNVVIEEVEGAVRSVKDNEERWREEMREVRGEVESIRDLVPKMIEKHSASQSSALSDLQNELRSLKALLQSRTAPPQHANVPGTSSPPSLTSSTSSLPGSSSVPHPANGANGSAVSQTTAAANALLTPKGRGIPAWQKAPAVTTGSSSPGGSRSSTPAPAVNGENEKEAKQDEAA